MTNKINENTRTGTAAPSQKEKNGNITVMSIGSPDRQIGLASIISILIIFAAWMIAAIAYICVPGSILGFAIGLICTFMNLLNGIGAIAVCFGCAVGCLGLCYPILVGARMLKHILMKREDDFVFNGRLFTICAIVAIAGAAIAGIGVLANGTEAIVLPGFLQAVFR